MVDIVFVDYREVEHSVAVDCGGSLMQAAVFNDIPGIDADCGCACSCATCHVYVKDEWLEKVGPINMMEESLLSLSTDRNANSRLSCQIQITEELDGLVVTIPEYQF